MQPEGIFFLKCLLPAYPFQLIEQMWHQTFFCTLHSRLMQTGILPAEWDLFFAVQDQLYTGICISPSLTLASVSYVLAIASDFSWVLCIGEKQVNKMECQEVFTNWQLCRVGKVVSIACLLHWIAEVMCGKL